MSERVTVNILTKDRIMEVYGLLVSLRDQTYKDWDLVLIDESNPPIAGHKTIFDIINRFKLEGHNVKYIHHPQSWLNIGKCRNEAIENSDTELILRVDDDSIMNIDYIERLVNLMNISEDIGAAGGIVPLFGQPEFVKNAPEIFNETIFDTEGNILKLGDDGGMCFEQSPWKPIPSHHLRSSFMFRKSAMQKIGMHPLEFGATGFREETDLCLRLAWAGYKMLTDVRAIAWHIACGSGGARVENYSHKVAINDDHFRRKIRMMFKEKGLPYNDIQ